jgi:hypothetical protein
MPHHQDRRAEPSCTTTAFEGLRFVITKRLASIFALEATTILIADRIELLASSIAQEFLNREIPMLVSIALSVREKLLGHSQVDLRRHTKVDIHRYLMIARGESEMTTTHKNNCINYHTYVYKANAF